MGYLGNNLQAAYSSYLLIDSISSSFNGTTTSFPLTVNGITPVPFPLNEQNVLISVGGVPQKPDASGAEGFKFSGSNIVFSSAPKTGEAFWGVVLAGADYVNAGTTYPDGSVSAPSITFNSEKTTGFYRPASGSIAVALNGVLNATFTSNGLNLYNATGGFTAVAPSNSASNNTITLPAGNGSAYQVLRNSATPGQLEFSTVSALTQGTAVTTTSGTSVDFTSIPSTVKRLTVLLAGVSTNGTSGLQLQLGDSGGIETSGYSGQNYTDYPGAVSAANTSAFLITNSGYQSAAHVITAELVLTNVTGNQWVCAGLISTDTTTWMYRVVGAKTLSAVLDRIRITTVGGTDTFDAGTINVLYE